MRKALVLALMLPITAFAATYEEIVAMVDAKTPPADVVAAIDATKDPFYPRHVYGLIDKEAPPEVIKAVAAKAAVFYDGTAKSLGDQAAEIHATVPPATIEVRSAADFAKVFEFFDAVKKDVDAAKASVPALEPKKDGETDAAFDKRKRAYDEAVMKAVAPVEGRIVQTTIDIELPAELGPFDGNECYPEAFVVVDLNGPSFQTWRNTMGGASKNELPIALDKKSGSTLSATFYGENAKRKLEVHSRKICPYEGAGSLSGVKVKMQLKRTPKGEDWAATSVFVYSNGETVEFKK